MRYDSFKKKLSVFFGTIAVVLAVGGFSIMAQPLELDSEDIPTVERIEGRPMEAYLLSCLSEHEQLRKTFAYSVEDLLSEGAQEDGSIIEVVLPEVLKVFLLEGNLEGINAIEGAECELRVFEILGTDAREIEYEKTDDVVSFTADREAVVVLAVTLKAEYAGGIIEDESEKFADSGNMAEAIIQGEDGYPKTYDNRDNLPNLRSQNPHGTCWAHAAIAMCEADAIKQGLAGTDVDLSEAQLAYFMYHYPVDEYGNTEGDDVSYDPRQIDPNRKVDWDAGGNTFFSQHAMMNWIGAAEESAVPYSTFGSVPDISTAYADSFRVRDTRDMRLSKGIGAAKEVIMKHGALAIAYKALVSGAYNSTYNSYYCPIQDNTNHAVTVVGWDDNFSRYNFNNIPEGDGAWLVRNSWVVAGPDSPFYNSENGYFWLSYYDRTLRDSVYSFEVEPAEAHDHLYTYDGSTDTLELHGNNEIYGANIFTSQAVTGDTLDAVSFFSSVDNQEYTVDVYLNVDADGPQSGTHVKAATTSGITDQTGYYSVKLRTPVKLDPGVRFSVVVSVKNPGGNAEMGVEYASNTWIINKASLRSGQSFYKTGVNDKWTDVKADNQAGVGNIRIKAKTIEGQDGFYDIIYNLDGGVNNSDNCDYYYRGCTVELAKPRKRGYSFGGWYLDPEFTQPIEKVGGDIEEEVTVYAKWVYPINATDYDTMLPTQIGKNVLLEEKTGIVTVNAKSKVLMPSTGWRITGTFDGIVDEENMDTVDWIKDLKQCKKYAAAKEDMNSGKTAVTTKACKKSSYGVYAVCLENLSGDVIVVNIENLVFDKQEKKIPLYVSSLNGDLKVEDALAMEMNQYYVKDVRLMTSGVFASYVDGSKTYSGMLDKAVKWSVGAGSSAVPVEPGKVTPVVSNKGIVGYVVLNGDGSVRVLSGSVKGSIKLNATVYGKVYKTVVKVK